MAGEPAHVSHGRPQLPPERQVIEGKVFYPLGASFPMQLKALVRLADHCDSPLQRNRRVIHNLCNLQTEISTPKMIRFPQHQFGLTLSFERNIDINPVELVVGNDRNWTGSAWVSRQERQKALETRSKWRIRIWLQDGQFRGLAASSLTALIEFFDKEGTCAPYGTASEFPDDVDLIVITHNQALWNSSGKKKLSIERTVEKLVDSRHRKWVSNEQRQKAIELTSIWTIAIHGPRLRSCVLVAAEWDVLIEAANTAVNEQRVRKKRSSSARRPTRRRSPVQEDSCGKPFQPPRGAAGTTGETYFGVSGRGYRHSRKLYGDGRAQAVSTILGDQNERPAGAINLPIRLQRASHLLSRSWPAVDGSFNLPLSVTPQAFSRAYR
jgi:hypothetical protein